MIRIYTDLSEKNRGLIILGLGVVLLLHTLGIFTSLFYWILILAALAMIAMGLMQSGLYDKVNAMIKKK
jgi:hypothetical protein